MVCVGILAAVLAVFSFLIMKKSAQKRAESEKRQWRKRSRRKVKRIRQYGRDHDSGADSGNWRGEPTNQVVFEETDDQVFVTVQTANLRREPSTDAEILATAPMSRLFVRTGVSAEWSRIKEGGKTYYVSNEVISTERPEAAGMEPCCRRQRGLQRHLPGKRSSLIRVIREAATVHRNPLDRVRHPRKHV